jgi:hypothetical protein
VYLATNKAPSKEIKTIFDRFASWLKDVYQNGILGTLNEAYRQENGRDLPVLTPEVRQVMDRMIASDSQIEQMEQIRGMTPAFLTQEQAARHGVTDEEWQEYQELYENAHGEAVAKHRAASIRQMKWLSGAKDKYLKKLQSEVKDLRKQTMAEVTEVVSEMPIYKAQAALREIVAKYGKPKGDINALMARAAEMDAGQPLDTQAYEEMSQEVSALAVENVQKRIDAQIKQERAQVRKQAMEDAREEGRARTIQTGGRKEEPR